MHVFNTWVFFTKETSFEEVQREEGGDSPTFNNLNPQREKKKFLPKIVPSKFYTTISLFEATYPKPHFSGDIYILFSFMDFYVEASFLFSMKAIWQKWLYAKTNHIARVKKL